MATPSPVDIPNAFVGKTSPPTASEVTSALGPSAKVWEELVSWFTNEQGLDADEWSSYSPKAGWSMRFKSKKRNIVYLVPCKGCFRVAFILGDKAVKAALDSGLPKAVCQAVKDAPKYPEGTGIRLIVKKSSDLPPIQKLTLAKLAN